MHLKKSFLPFMSLCVAVFAIFCIAGCEDSLETSDTPDTAVLSLRLDEVFQEKAYIRLNHDGSQEDYWYYIVTQDMEAEADSLLEAHIGELLASDGMIVANAGTNKNITLEGLSAKTGYRVIASRILPDGSMTGNVAELVFVTLRNPDVFEINPAWEIAYKERRVDADDPDQESEVFSCTVKDDASEETYVPCLLTRSDFENAYGGNLRACFEDYVAFRNLENVKWPNVVTSESFEHVEDRLRHGDYILFMIGIDESGELTGYYARTDCTIEQENASDAYRRWIGKWTLTGSCGDAVISYPIEISPDENNLYYRMYGWETGSAEEYFKTLPQDLPILLYFEKSSGDVFVVSEEFGDLDDPTLAEFYDFFLYGCVEIDYDGVLTEIPIDIPNMKVARLSLVGENRAVAEPETFSFDLYDVHYDAKFLYFNYSYTSMIYAGLVPVTTDSVVPRIDTIMLER